MLKQSMHSFVLLYPNVLLEGWNVEKVSERYEGEKWGTFGFRLLLNWDVSSKGIFLDIMEPVFRIAVFLKQKEIVFNIKGLCIERYKL